MVRRGFSMVEILISLGLITVFVASIATTLTTTRRFNTASAKRALALTYAQGAMEQVVALQSTAFACQAAAPNVVTGQDCERMSDHQHCTLRAGALNCWTEQPDGLVGSMETLHIDQATQHFVSGTDTPGAGYSRSIKLENQSSPSADPGVKTVTVTVNWDDQGPHTETVSTVLTNWLSL